MAKKLDDIHKKLIAFFKANTSEEGLTLREIGNEIWVWHPQTVLNKLNQLVLRWYFVKEAKWFRLIKDKIENKFTDIVQLPIYGFAQCWHHGKAITSEYSQEKIPVTMAFVGTSQLDNCFFVRAKWNSMEPKIQDGDLVLIKQQDTYDPNDYVFVVHNELPKLKKIVREDSKLFLESVNRFFTKKEVSKYDQTKVIGVVKKVIKEF